MCLLEQCLLVTSIVAEEEEEEEEEGMKRKVLHYAPFKELLFVPFACGEQYSHMWSG